MAIMEKYREHLEKGADDQSTPVAYVSGSMVLHQIKMISSECLEKVDAAFAKFSINVPEDVIDRAHRIGKG